LACPLSQCLVLAIGTRQKNIFFNQRLFGKNLNLWRADSIGCEKSIKSATPLNQPFACKIARGN
jgi:hypothetical protein